MKSEKLKNKYCYFCKNFRSGTFCGYSSCSCQVYGSLDVDQTERHPDRTANTCADYIEIKNATKSDLYQHLLERESK